MITIKKMFATVMVLGIILVGPKMLSVNAGTNHDFDDLPPATVTVPLN